MAALLYILAEAEMEDARHVPRIRLSYSRSNAFELKDSLFVKNFRLTKELAYTLVEELKPFLASKSLRKNTLTTEDKVLCALSFFASGCYQHKIGNDFTLVLAQTTVSKCIRDVSLAMSQNLLQKYVKFPDDERSQIAAKGAFFEYCGIGGVLGAIDCTHVSIIAPTDDERHFERNYINRKGWHSLNVQLICDMNMSITNIVARFPGCTHDSFIWRSSVIRRLVNSGNLIHGNGWLLGDSGYPQEQHIHVPFSNAPPGSTSDAYNKSHAIGRCVIERCNGVLKNRFRCLLRHRTLHYKPEMASRIINSCAILHNLCIEADLIWEDFDLPEEDQLFDTV